MTSSISVVPFDSEAATLARTGGKGLNLVRMTRAGFPVPRGFILPTEAYRAFVEANALTSGWDRRRGRGPARSSLHPDTGCVFGGENAR